MQEINDVSLSKGTINDDIFSQKDEFKSASEDLIKLSGLSNNFKRSVKRKLEKSENNALVGDQAKSKQIIPDKYGYGLFDVVEPPYNLYSLAKIYELSSPNYAAINAKVSNIVGLGYELEPNLKVIQRIEEMTEQEQITRARRKLARAREEVIEWLESRNDEDTFTYTLIKAYIDSEATGNGYLEIGRKTNGEIGYVGHIPSATVRVRRLRDGFVQIVNGKAVFFRNFQDLNTSNPVGTDTRPNEILHLKNYSPTNNYYGVPAIVSAKNAMAGNEFASKFNLEYFENKAVPRYILWLKGAKLSERAEQKLFEFFSNNLRSQSHRTIIVPLPADDAHNKVEVKMEPIENKVQDSSFENYRKSNEREILMAHRVPPSKVGGAENLGLAAAREADRTFKEQVCRPAQDALGKKINRIVSEKTNLFKLHFNELTLTDEDTQSKIDERYLRMQVIVPNEVRERLGYSSLEDGDKPVVLNASARAEQTAQTTRNRVRDQDRQSNSSDASENPRNEQGAGRQQA
jgi:PBSX family phage portal protein